MNTNKVVFNETTIIDLTEDNVTAADVTNGYYFHLADGTRTVGTDLNTPEEQALSTIKTTTTASKTMTISLTKEPEWFVVYCTTLSTARADPVPIICYDGSTIVSKRMNSASNNANIRVYALTDSTFSYSGGTLTLTNVTYYFPVGTYTIYYG